MAITVATNTSNPNYLNLFNSAKEHQIEYKVTIVLQMSINQKRASDLSAEFLQGLITNDIFHLTKNSGIFTMFLNNQGRVIFDTFISKNKTDDQEFLTDCDRKRQLNI